VRNQRTNYNNGKLSKDRVDLLNLINFIWDPQQKLWDDMYQHLMNYKEKYNSTLVHTDFCIDDVRLGRWVDTQRYRYSTKRILQDRVNRLNSLDFVWVVRE